ncbi:hypothetical protein [Sphingomonas sp.]|jgi:hypothetical protein|uniref:hypothetical protein n=1 Tax=Sphingomonas sp. TaxID=28214 RepID=UPI002DEC2744|nr:hypothetical protein [Sphingomonas sp.]
MSTTASESKKTLPPEHMAQMALNPCVTAAATVIAFSKRSFGEVDIQTTYEALQKEAKKVRAGDLGGVEDMLVAQASALNSIFLDLASRAQVNMGEYINAADRYMKLALKAQGQCRATLETLAAVKNPPLVVAKQANISTGPQQVNNGVAHSARAEEKSNQPSGLLEAGSGERLDSGTTGAAIGGNPALEPVGALNGAAHH